MKVLFTVNTYYPLKDGVQAVTQYCAEGLAQKGHKVTVVTLNNSITNTTDEYINGVRVIRVNVLIKHALYFGDKKEYKELIQAIAEEIDVMINVCLQCATTDLLLNKLDSLPCKKILYMHGMFECKWEKDDLKNIKLFGHKVYNQLRWGFYYKTKRKYFEKYNRVIQLHEYDRGYIYFKTKYKIISKVLENAADDEFFDLTENSPVSNKRYALCVANYMDGKNQKSILHSFYKAHNSNDLSLIFIGSEKNKYYDELINLNERFSIEYGKRDVEFKYNIQRKEVSNYVKNSILFLMGSRWEVYPISLIESMAAGIPYISTNVGIVKYLPGGIVVDNEDEMSYWINLLNKNDTARKSLGDFGRNYALTHLSIGKKILELEAIMEELI